MNEITTHVETDEEKDRIIDSLKREKESLRNDYIKTLKKLEYDVSSLSEDNNFLEQKNKVISEALQRNHGDKTLGVINTAIEISKKDQTISLLRETISWYEVQLSKQFIRYRNSTNNFEIMYKIKLEREIFQRERVEAELACEKDKNAVLRDKLTHLN